MQQTTRYQFNIIDTSDAFSPTPLNDNAEKLEAALIAHEGTVSAALSQHKAETDAVLSSHKAETDAALSSHKAATDAALGAKADKAALDTADKTLSQTITAVEQGARLFHLAGPVVGDGKTAVTVSLSGINIAQYRALLIFVTAGQAGKITIYNTEVPFGGAGSGAGLIWLFNVDSMVVFIGHRTVISGSSYSEAGNGYQFSSVPWNSLTSITGSGGVSFFDVYGLKA